MVTLTKIVPLAALQVGVIFIAAVLWREARCDERRRRWVRNLQSLLHDAESVQKEEDHFTRAA
jgi:hypothetical protein